MGKKPSFSDQLRKAVLTCGKTRYRLSRETGIQESVLCRFVTSDAGISLQTIDKLVEAIGASLHVEAPTKTTKKG